MQLGPIPPEVSMAKRTVKRIDYPAAYEDYDERSKREDEEETEEEEDEDEDEDEEGEEGEEAEEGEEGEEGEDGEPVAKKKKPPPKKVAKPKAPAKPKRSRAGKVVRLRVVWGVFDNSNKKVATYEYSKRKEAEEHAARMQADKKHTYFVQPIKEPLEEKT